MLPARLKQRPDQIPAGQWALAYADSVLEAPSWYLIDEGVSIASVLKGTAAGKRDLAPHDLRCFLGWGNELGMELQPDPEVYPEAGQIAVVRCVPRYDWVTVIIILLVISLAATIASLVLTLTQKQEERDTQNRFDSPTLRGTRNRVAIHEPIPKVYGRYRTKPPLGAYTYTEIVGTDHYLRALFVVGYGPLVMDIADMKIGETPIAQFSDVEIEVRPGEDDDLPITLYPVQVTQEDLNVVLSDQNMAPEDVVPGEPDGSTGWQQRTTDLSTDEIGIELLLPRGIGNITGKGQNQVASIGFQIEFRKVGDTIWIQPPLATMRVSALGSVYQGPGQVVIQGFRLGSFQVGINFPTPAREQYEVRIKTLFCQGIDVDGHNTFFHETHWFALKSFRNEAPWNKKGIAMVAIRIRATDQLQGTIDDFSLIARSKLPTWNGTAWTAPIETRNPAWIYADILRGAANPDPVGDEFIDANRLLDWSNLIETHTTPDENGDPILNPMYFDGVIDYRTTVYRMLSDVAGVARASPQMRDGIYSIVFDHDRSAEVPVQMITPANILAGSFGSRKLFVEEAHGYRISFRNEAKDWGEDEVVLFTPGYTAATARIYEKIEWTGITDPDRAVDETRFMVFERKYRPEIYRFDMDLENLVFERGDLVVFAHDVPLLGLAYGRISSLIGNVTGFKLDEKVVFEPGVNYGVRIRRHQTVLEVMDSVPVTNPATAAGIDVETNTLTLVTPITSNQPAVGDLVSFGEVGIETRRCVVRSISPQADLVATIELIDEAPQIFQDLTDPIPPYDPGINRPRDLPPLAPEIISVSSPDHLNLYVSFRLLSGFGRGIARCEIQVRVSPDGPWEDVPAVPPAGMVTAVIPGLELDRYYDVRVRAVSSTNLFSPWTQRDNFLHSSHAVDISRYSISDLRLENILSDPNQFVGPSPSFRWQIQVIDGTELGDPVSDAPRQASIVRESEIDRFDGYVIRILEAVWDADQNAYVPGVMIDEDVIQDNRYAYTFDHNVDDGGPRRVLFFEVAAQIDGLLTESALQLASNPSPDVPELINLSGANGTWIEILLGTASADADWEGVEIWMSASAGFVPTQQNLVFKGRMDRVLNIPSTPGTTYYFRYASFDRFSSEPTTLNLSAEQSITTGSLAGLVNQIRESRALRYTSLALRFTQDWPNLTPGPPWNHNASQHTFFKLHELSFTPPVNGVLQVDWEAAIGYSQASNDFWQTNAWILLYYSIGASPVATASQWWAAETHITTTTFYGWGVTVPQLSPSLATIPVHSVGMRLDVLAGQTVWIYAWLEWWLQPQQHWLFHDIFTMHEVVNP